MHGSWVDLIIFPLGRVILIENLADCLLTTVTVVPSNRKWPVAPELETAYCTVLVNFGVSKMVLAIERTWRFLACTIVFHAVILVGLEADTLVLNFFTSVISITAASSSDCSSSLVTAVTSSEDLSTAVFEITTVSSPDQSSSRFSLRFKQAK